MHGCLAGALLSLLSLIAAGTLQGSEPALAWLPSVPRLRPGKFTSEKTGCQNYTAGWSGIVAGNVAITKTHNGNRQTLHATLATTNLAKFLYPFDADYLAIGDARSLTPIANTIIENYRDEKRSTHLRFTAGQVVRRRSSVPAQRDDGKIRVTTLPNILDLQTSLLYLRSQSLAPGDEIQFLTYATSSPYLARISVLGRENIKVAAGKYSAIKLRLNLTGIDKSGSLQPYRRAREIYAWISDDADRTYLKFTASLLIGQVFVELAKPSDSTSIPPLETKR